MYHITKKYCMLYMRAYGASISDVIDDVTWLYDVILVKSQSSKTSHSKTRTRIDNPCGQTLLQVSVTDSDHLRYILTNLIVIGVYTW